MSTATLLILTRNRATQLRVGLDTIKARQYSDIEMLVIDDGSTDETPAILNNSGLPLRIKTLARGNGWLLNPSPIFNEGHRQSTSDVVIEQGGEICHLTNCVTPLINVCRRGVVALARCYNGSIGDMNRLQSVIDSGEYEFPEDKTPDIVPFLGDRLPILRDKYGAQLYCGWERPVPFMFMGAIHRGDFDAVGGYNEKIIRNNDGDLAKRLWMGGVKFCFVGNAIAFHLEHPKV